MGGGSYDPSLYSTRSTAAAAAGTGMFTHSHSIRSGKTAAAVHDLLNVLLPNTRGERIRESLDVDGGPPSRPVAVMFDVTGSMGQIPTVFMDKLPALMGTLVKRGVLPGPQVLMAAIGDAFSDRVPLQIGQFEADNRMDEALANIYLEGAGGGQVHESYELAMYYMARHTRLDSLTKRGEKGFLFLIGDELPYAQVNPDQVRKLIGDELTEPIATAAILDELREQYEVYWIYPDQGSYTNDPHVQGQLKSLFGERLIHLDDAENVLELIVSIIGVEIGLELDTVASRLKEEGCTDRAITSATTALTPYMATLAKAPGAGVVSGNLSIPATA